MMRRFTFLTLLLCLLATISGTAQASVEEVRRYILKALKDNQAIMQLAANMTPNKQPAFIYEGPLLVEEAEGYYTVTLPNMSVRYGTDFEIDYGVTSINLAQSATPDYWKGRIAMATPIKLGKPGKEEGIHIHIGRQTSDILWHKRASIAPFIFMRFNDVRVATHDDITLFTMDEMSFELSLTDVNTDTYINFLENIESKTYFDFVLLELAKAKDVSMTIKNLHMDIEEINESIPEHLREAEENYAQRYDGPISIKQLSYSMGERHKAGDLIDFIGFFEFADMDLPEATDQQEMFPLQNIDASTNFYVENFPKQILSNLKPHIDNAISQSGKQETDLANADIKTLIDTALKHLQENESKFVVNYKFGDDQNFYIRLIFELLANMRAQYSATGSVTLDLMGMDKIIAGQLDDPNNPQAQMLKGTADGFAEKTTDESGNIIERYKLVADKAGNVTLNGQDIKFLINLLSGALTQPDPAPNAAPEQEL